MPDITFTLSAAHLTRLVDAICATEGYEATLDDGRPNPETRPQFSRRMIREHLRHVVRDYENELARAAVQSPLIDVT
ncbi:MAG TPA: hypothetical protein VI729_05965 [Anaerolineales bacterium]|nr:hypothetical protein [Anaerolineales bacterium]